MRIITVALAVALVACAKPAAEAPAQTPSTSSASVARIGGCRDVYLYGANEDATQVVIVDVDAKAVGLKKGEKRTFDLASPPKNVRVWLDVYLRPARVDGVHCTKTPAEQQMAERYPATAGTLTIELAADGVVDARIDGAKFALDGRPTIEMTTRRFDKIRVGWLPG